MLAPGDAVESPPQEGQPHDHSQPIHATPSHQALEHAKIALDYFNALKKADKTDVNLKSGGRQVGTGHRLILAAFSPQFKYALLMVQGSPTADLDIDPNETGIPWNVLTEILDFCYTGQCRFSEQLLFAARTLKCETLTALLEKAQEDASSSPSYLHQQLLVDEYHAATFLDELYQMKIDGDFLDCTFSQATHRSETVRLHQLVLCAYIRHIEEARQNHAEGCLQFSVVIDLPHTVTRQDLICVVDFFYSGHVRAARRRLRLIRATALCIGAETLVAEVDSILSSGRSEEEGERQEQHGEYDEAVEMGYGEENAARPTTSLGYKPAVAHEEDYIGGDDDEMMQSPYGDYDYEQSDTPMRPQNAREASDVVGSSVENYSHIYHQYVEGPRRGKRGGTYPSRPHPLKVKTVSRPGQENEQESDESPSVTLISAPSANTRRRETDSYGYGLPEIRAPTEFTVPLVVGNQQDMMERPFKCPYCNHRTREKSAVEKHVRCMHTKEAPFTCRFCSQTFKVQSNLVRHHRAHTGEKPYVCRKCGTAYADKKNMDAHIYREHLKQSQIECAFPNCVSKFWRQDRYILHYNKQHATRYVTIPANQGDEATEEWVDQ